MRLKNSTFKISNEIKLIFYCARVEMDAQIQSRVKELFASPIDWDRVIERAAFHSVASLIYFNLNKLNLNSKVIPQEIISKLKNYYYATLVRNMQFWTEMQKILNALKQSKIQAIPIKGIILCENLYHNLGLRPMVDIDLLIREDNLSAFEEAVSRLGYRKELQGHTEDYYRKYHCNLIFRKENSNFLVEAHWSFSFPRPNKIFFSKLWERGRQKEINGVKMYALSAEDTLFCLALHLRGHTRFLILRHICDIYELLEQFGNDFDWDYVVDEAEKNRIKSNLYFALSAANELLDASVPESILERIRPNLLRRKLMRVFIEKANFINKRFDRKELLKIKYIILRFLLLDKIKDFLSYVLFSPKEELTKIYLSNMRFKC